MNRSASIIQAEMLPYLEALVVALEMSANHFPNPCINPETGEDMVLELMEASADFFEMLLEMDEDELISFHSRKRLN